MKPMNSTDLPDSGECSTTVVHPDAVARARSALADPTRFSILNALVTCELCVCDLAELVGVSQSGVSHQLRLLRDRGLVTFRREGNRAIYRLVDEHVKDLIVIGLEHAREGREQ